MGKLLSQAARQAPKKAPREADPADQAVNPDGSALTPPAPRAAPEITTNVTGSLAVPLGSVVPYPANPRTRIGDVTDLADSIAAVGQLQPATVVDADKYLVLHPEHAQVVGEADYVAIMGSRRHAALTQLGQPTIDVTIKDHLAVSRGVMLAAALGENVDRQDLDPIDEANAVQRLIEELGGARAAGEAFGKSRGWAVQRVGLLRLVDELQTAVRAGDMPIEPARRISQLPADQQLAAWEAERPTAVTAVTPPDDDATPANVTAVTAAAPRPSPLRRAIRRLGKTPRDMAQSLRAELDEAELRELVRALTMDD